MDTFPLLKLLPHFPTFRPRPPRAAIIDTSRPMASSIARARSLSRDPQQSLATSEGVDVASAFSFQTHARRKGSLASLDDSLPDTTTPPLEKASSTAMSTTSDVRSMNMDEIHERMRELERQPTQAEIDELMAQYDDESDSGGSADDDRRAYSDDDGELGAGGAREEVIMKVLVVGNARCGKTSTIRRYVAKEFKEEYSSTIGADFIEKTIDYDSTLRVHLQLWDIAGQDRFAKLTRAYFREAKGALIVCDITRENTIDAVVTWKNEIDVCCKDLNNGDNIPVVMVANKSDLLVDPMGALNIGVNMQKCVTKNNIVEWFRASAKSGEHVDEAFQCLLDKMVEEHRKLEEQRVAKSTEADAVHSGDNSSSLNDDVIRLSQYTGPPRSNSSGFEFCECN